MKNLQDRVAVVTGASRGLGTYIAKELAGAGCHVVLAARTAPALESLAEEIRGMGRRALAVACDVADADSRRSLVSAAQAEFGRIDILVNNAGIEVTAHFEDQDDEELDRIIRVNLIAAMQLTRLVLPGMLERKRGHIVNIASLAGKVPVPYSSPYSASKAGLIAFTEGIRMEFRKRGVSASAICPGFVAEAGMYADWERQTGAKATFLAGTVKPERVARDVVKAIRKDRPEMLQFWVPARPTAALAELMPGTFEKIYPVFGVQKTFGKLADARREEQRAAEREAAASR
ncbi:SDR family oxidoreductase [Tepidiforma sp.]|uniref:SDR family NAD(P)-dependent oxidoreductase n=1 Tax=Tepidiforma sp. TaxID=2682230 RepID=UPI0021DF404E|nr:SDR family NAD(P)-dependent oxidoreductase [Tepidiforma sp.]MCX7617015.1 SDR family NAD(P)-dependent oxidoreductase [Tepidiforma sp.]GIW18111.1 MAG: short-chain dehydrogenase [Tepidiforma sp.]